MSDRMSKGELIEIGAEVIDFAPGYDLHKHNPVTTLEERMGNCAAKTAIACGLIVIRNELEPSVAYNAREHGKVVTEQTFLGYKQKTQIKHIDLLVPAQNTDGTGGRFDVLGLAFGMQTTGATGYLYDSTPEVRSPNTRGQNLAQVFKGRVRGTGTSKSLGYPVTDWRTGISRYVEKLDQPAPDFDEMLEKIAELTDNGTKKLPESDIPKGASSTRR